MPMMIDVGSVSNAMRGKRVLEQHGIRAYVRRHAVTEGRDGCGYSLAVSQNDPRVTAWLRESGVKVIRVKERERI